MKSRDTFAPIGPYIVTADEIRDPHKLQVKLTVNGTVKLLAWVFKTAVKLPEPAEVVEVAGLKQV